MYSLSPLSISLFLSSHPLPLLRLSLHFILGILPNSLKESMFSKPQFPAQNHRLNLVETVYLRL